MFSTFFWVQLLQQTTFLAMFEIDSSSPEGEIIINLGNKEWGRLDLDLSLFTGKNVLDGLTITSTTRQTDWKFTLKGPKWQVVHFQQTNLQMTTAIQNIN